MLLFIPAGDRLGFCYIEKRPDHDWMNILYPFEFNVWTVIPISWILVSVLLWITFHPIGIWFWLWATYNALLFQELCLRMIKLLEERWNPNAFFRFILGLGLALWLLCFSVILPAYSSNLSNLLTRARKDVPVKTFEDLLDRNWEVGFGNTDGLNHLVGNSSLAFNTIRKKLIQFGSKYDCMEHALGNPEFACVGLVKGIVVPVRAYFSLNRMKDVPSRIRESSDNTFSEIGMKIP